MRSRLLLIAFRVSSFEKSAAKFPTNLLSWIDNISAIFGIFSIGMGLSPVML